MSSRIRRPNREFAVEKLRQLINAGLGDEDEAILQKLESSSSDGSASEPQDVPSSNDDAGEEGERRKRPATVAAAAASKKKRPVGSDDDSDYSIKSDAYGQQDDSDVASSFDDTEDSKELISASSDDGVHRKKKHKKKESKAEKEAQKQIRFENKENKEKRKGDSNSKKGGTLGEVRQRNAAKVFTHAQRMEIALTRAKEQTILLRKMEEEASAAIANDEATAADLMALSSKKGRARGVAAKKKKTKGKKRERKGKGDSDSDSDGGTTSHNQVIGVVEDTASGSGFLSVHAQSMLLGICRTRIGVTINPIPHRQTATVVERKIPDAPSGSSSDLISDHNFECSDTPSFTFEERRLLGLNTVREHRRLLNRRRLRHRRREGAHNSITDNVVEPPRQFSLVSM